jgi:hypothetical protein
MEYSSEPPSSATCPGVVMEAQREDSSRARHGHLDHPPPALPTVCWVVPENKNAMGGVFCQGTSHSLGGALEKRV